MKYQPNLLIVDDDRINLKLLEGIIRKIDVNLIKALSGAEALEKTHGIDLALAIIDVRMPLMNGYELALKMNEERPENKVPVIFLTANIFDKLEVFKGYGSGAVDYIFKPVSGQILLSKIKIFLDLFNQRQFIIQKVAQLNKTTDELSRVNLSLTKSEAKYRSYIDNAPDAVFILDENGRYVDVNEATCRISGYSEKELLTMSFSDLAIKKSDEDVLTYFEKLVKTGSSKADMMIEHKDGTLRWLSREAVKLSETRFLNFSKEITDRKEIEEALRLKTIKMEMQNLILIQALVKAKDSSKKYAELYDFAPSGYFTLSTRMVILELNHSGAHMLGKERSQLKEKHFDLYISKDTLPLFYDFFRDVFESKVKEVCEVMVETENGRPKVVFIEGMVIGNGMQCLINVVDITERKVAEQALKVSEEKYKTIVSVSPDGILLIDQKGIIIEVSEIGLKLFGANTKDDMVGKCFLRSIPADQRDTIKGIIKETMTYGLAQNTAIKIRNINRSMFAAETSSTLIKDLNGMPISFMIIIRDISQRKKIETKQLHADRMVNLGEMASNIAHEINQPLNIISMVMDKIMFDANKADVVDIETLKNKSNKIFENIIRIKNIIDHVRAFSRNHDDYVITEFDINKSIENAVSMIVEEFKHLGIKLNLQLEKQITEIPGNTYKFEQVIINLLINAKDAVIDKNNHQETDFVMNVGIRSYQEGQFLIVEVTDNGIGIKKDDIDNIILPFYTTKEEGKGTGVGLSICYQIIKEMNGKIDITSNYTYGTTIKIVLNIQKQK